MIPLSSSVCHDDEMTLGRGSFGGISAQKSQLGLFLEGKEMCIVPIGNGQMNRILMLFGFQEKVNVDLKLKGNYACYDIYGI